MLIGEALDLALVRQLHAAGPQAVTQFLREISALDPGVAEFIHERLLAYAVIPADVYQALAAHDWGTATQ